MKNMRFQKGDRVRIKSLDWYNENKNKVGKVWTSGKGARIPFEKHMSKWCGKVMTISDVRADHYTMIEDLVGYWTDEMIEGLVEDENNHLTEIVVDTVRESNDRYRIVLDPRFDIEVDEGEYYAVRRKKEYPKTYVECCKIMNYCCIPVATKTTHREELMRRFQFLILYRDAYWKIAGEEMGLGKPWEPDWKSDDAKYVISALEDMIIIAIDYYYHKVLAFPTEEMRDAFYENFKGLINECKELL